MKETLQKYLIEHYYHDQEDGHLHYKISGHGNNIGDRVGWQGDLNFGKYWLMSIRGKRYRAHRIIWIFHHGYIPNGYEIDHIDGNRINNRIDNLRLVTRAQNGKNKINYTDKHFGVRYDARYKKWRAQIKENGNVRHIGTFNTENEAIKARKEAEKKYGFHAGHGKKLQFLPDWKQSKMRRPEAPHD